MDYKELAKMCRYLSDTPSYTAFHDEVEREVICDSCKGGLCYEKEKDAHWCMYEALQRAANAITDLIARCKILETRLETAEKMVKEYQDVIVPGYRERAEKAESERDAAVSDIEDLMCNCIDGCHVCANAIVVHREPCTRLDCALKDQICTPKWRGVKEE